MTRTIILRQLGFDYDLGSFQATTELRIETAPGKFSSLAIDARLGDSLQAKITRLIEDEIGAQLNAEPSSTGEPPVYRDPGEEIPF